MKLRLGFVSNSSSSSFCLFGTRIDPKKFEKHFGIKYEGPDDEKTGFKNFDDLVYKTISPHCCDLAVETGNPNKYDDGDPVWVGVPVQNIFDNCDNQTISECKAEIVNDINKIAKVPLDKNDFHVYTEGWYDG